MAQSELEKKLDRKIIRTRLAVAAVTILGLIIAIIFTALYEGSRTVTEYDYKGHVYHTSVDYNHNFGFGIAAGIIIFLTGCPTLLICMFFLKYDTAEHGGSVITVYRGFASNILYIDGEESARSTLFLCDLEGKLKSGETVTAVLRKYSAKLIFSKGNSSIEL